MVRRPPEGHHLTAWDDPAYTAAKLARAEAYAEFTRVAGANPYRYGQDGFDHYYTTFTEPAKAAFLEAHRQFRTEVTRVIDSFTEYTQE